MSRQAGLTVVELLVAVSLLSAVGLLIESYLSSQTFLFAKNTAINQTHVSVRTELDRLADELQRAVGSPELLDINGAVTTTSPAAGLRFDRLVGDPYVLNYPGSPGLSANDTSVTIVRSTDALCVAPVPEPGDSLLIDLPTGETLRAQIETVLAGLIDANTQQQSITLTLSAKLGTDLDWRSPLQSPPQQKTVRIVRREAFIVIPADSRDQLRFYPGFEPLPPLTVGDILNSSSQYVVITDAVSTATVTSGNSPDATPFSIDSSSGTRLVHATLGTQAQDYTNSLQDKQAGDYNTFVRVRATLSSRLR